jgi:hypothetical protein
LTVCSTICRQITVRCLRLLSLDVKEYAPDFISLSFIRVAFEINGTTYFTYCCKSTVKSKLP